MSTGEAAALLNVSNQAVQKMIKSGVLLAHLVPRDSTRKRWVIDRASLDAVLATRRAESQAEPPVAVHEAVPLAREAIAGLRAAERTIEGLRTELEQERSARREALVERDIQATTALAALERVDVLQQELEQLRVAHVALMGAHAALFGAAVSR